MKMMLIRTVVTVAGLLISGLLAEPAKAQTSTGAAPVDMANRLILADPKVMKTLDDLKQDDAAALDEQKRITEIPAPPFKEKVRAEYFLKRMQELGFKDASIDAEGNVIGLRKGSGGGRPKLVVSAHLDTVFPEGTDVTVKEKDGVILAPGIGDDSRGLAALLSLIKAVNANGIAMVGEVMFVGTVGEEELGNLRGVKALFRDHADIDGFISIDGLGITRVVNQATGSHRYEMIFRGPGGHSFQEFGLPSATHAMGRAIAKISDLQTPSDPKTTFTVGTVSGGTSVNAIAGEARMAVDMRSNSTDELLKLEARLLDLVKQAVADENARWNSDKIVGRDQADRRSAGRHCRDGFADRAGDPASGQRHHRRPARYLCGLQHRFQSGDVARHSGGDDRWRRRRRQLALPQRMVQAGRRLSWPAKCTADDAGAGGPRWRYEAGAGGAARQVRRAAKLLACVQPNRRLRGRAAQPQVDSGLFKFEEPVTFNSKVKIGVRLRAPSAAAWDGQCPPRFTTRIGEPTGRSCWWAFCVARRSWASAFSPDSSPSTPRS